jgi:hypothetical protein
MMIISHGLRHHVTVTVMLLNRDSKNSLVDRQARDLKALAGTVGLTTRFDNVRGRRPHAMLAAAGQ